MNIESILIISFTICMILYYIYETDFIWEYLYKLSGLFKKESLQSFFYGKLLLEAYKTSQSGNYIEYINTCYNTFFTRLISCPICFGFWISLVFSAATKIIYLPVFSFVSLTMYFFLKILTKISSKL